LVIDLSIIFAGSTPIRSRYKIRFTSFQ
jgi:hypothetical protein